MKIFRESIRAVHYPSTYLKYFPFIADSVGTPGYRYDVFQRNIPQRHAGLHVQSREAATPARPLPTGQHLLHHLIPGARREEGPALHALPAHRGLLLVRYLGVEHRVFSQRLLLELLFRPSKPGPGAAHPVLHEESQVAHRIGRCLQNTFPTTPSVETILPEASRP
ncbi:hypothetical protein AVEN_87800-1 [Araneus ventricosus]|uniref:Uncharacterized protein n=1 Tax=Araneus ventricosus TaxID=182803 RepID=A0A4Y2BAU6_ARAVE|nr:hypothetical protein AVEN_87800-1 [Araneus ventricosus]